jgi:hypothetical protein
MCILSLCLQLHYVLRLEPFWSPRDIEFELIALVERLEACGLNGGMVHENIFSRWAANESVTLVVVKPLYCSLFFHSVFFLFFSAPESGV